MLTAAQMAARYAAGMAGAAQKYTDGVNAVTESPTAKAATPEAQALYLRNIQESVSSGRRAAALQNVSLQQWKDAAVKKGANRLASGAQAALPKVQAFFQNWAPVFAQASQAAAAIPNDGSIETALAKVRASITVMRQAAGKMG